jgi:hypothetical protein
LTPIPAPGQELLGGEATASEEVQPTELPPDWT